MNNLQQQSDEFEVLSSIYGDKWKCESESGTSYSMQIDDNIKLYIYLNDNYPSESPPTYLLQAPCLTVQQKQNVETEFSEIYLQV